MEKRIARFPFINKIKEKEKKNKNKHSGKRKGNTSPKPQARRRSSSLPESEQKTRSSPSPSSWAFFARSRLPALFLGTAPLPTRVLPPISVRFWFDLLDYLWLLRTCLVEWWIHNLYLALLHSGSATLWLIIDNRFIECWLIYKFLMQISI